MIEFLYSLDKSFFLFINSTLSNPVTDVLWPLITDYDKLWPVRIVLVCAWVMLIWKGGRTGRTVACLIIPLIFISDRLNSAVIKEAVGRARPCHIVNEMTVVQDVHLLVECGSGKSFPSSHAVNNFALATLLAFYYRRWMMWFIVGASLVALSRVGVGVHYPSDIIAGAIVGVGIALTVIWMWSGIDRKLSLSQSDDSRGASQ